MNRVARMMAVAAALLVAGAAGACQSRPAPAPAPATPNLAGVWGPRFVQSIAENPPMLPETLAAFKALDVDNKDPLAICKPPGIPRLMNLAFPFEIVQTPQIVYFLFEYDQHVRRVFIGGTHPKDMDPTWLGHSIGHWEGQTLVVDTVGFNDQTWLDMRGHLHSDALHIIERFTRSEDGKSLKHEVTIDDPKMYSKPWQGLTKSHTFRPDLKIQEFVCETA
jgi:hypothetical protein